MFQITKVGARLEIDQSGVISDVANLAMFTFEHPALFFRTINTAPFTIGYSSAVFNY
jgi:hypothetical protein